MGLTPIGLHINSSLLYCACLSLFGCLKPCDIHGKATTRTSSPGHRAGKWKTLTLFLSLCFFFSWHTSTPSQTLPLYFCLPMTGPRESQTHTHNTWKAFALGWVTLTSPPSLSRNIKCIKNSWRMSLNAMIQDE